MPRDDDYDKVDAILRVVATKWIEQIRHARKHKHTVFGSKAAECQSFYTGPKDWMELMSGGKGDMLREDDAPDPSFRISINKAFEYVQLFGPALYYENPVRTVKPRMPVDVPVEFLAPVFGQGPFAEQAYMDAMSQEQARVMTDGLRAMLIGAYLNWSPHESRLSQVSRQAIEEALVKGRSCLWTELHTPPNANFKFVQSTFDSVDNLFVDPDASSLEQAQWIAKKCVHPVWQVERDYGLAPGKLKANTESIGQQATFEDNTEAQERRRKGESNDLLVYYKIWSKMGIGGRLPGFRESYGKVLEMFGDYCFIVIAPDQDFVLNLPPDTLDQAFGSPQELTDSVFARTAWPTPFWARDGEWPVSCLDFVSIAGSAWPMAPLSAGMGELKALNWLFSFMTGHIKNTSRDFIVMLKSLPEETKQTILAGRDLELIEINSTENRPISDMVSWLQHPQMNKDIWEVVDAVEKLFDKRVGLTELMYGTTGTQIRSAEEASLKQQNMSVRPQDMAKQVETWQAGVAAKEAATARYHLVLDDLRPVLGDMGAMAWVHYVSTTDPQIAARQLEYQIESGSTQKPNKNHEIAQMGEAFTTLAPIFQAYGQTTGDMGPMNNLLSDFAKSRDLDPNRYQLLAAMPPPPPAQVSGGPEAVQQEPTGNPVPQG